MRLRVRFSGMLPSLLHVPAEELIVEAAPGSTLSDVMCQLDLPEGAAMAFAVNGRVRPPEFQPQDGDEVVAIQSLAGG